MKLRSFGKLLSLVAVLALIVTLVCAMAVTANAESIDVLSSDGDMTITVTAPYKECGKVKLSWNTVNGAAKYAVYCNEEHVANSAVAYYSIGSLEVAAHGEEEIIHSFKIVAIDKNGNEIAYGAVEAAAKHNYATVVTEPTCTESGYTTHTCACGDVYVDAPVDELGHDYGEWIEIVDPLCELDGVLGHYTCSRCLINFDAELEILESLTIPAIGHSFTNHVYDNNATCTEDGTKTALCDNGCGTTETLTDEGTALGHSFTNHVSDGNATCTVDGTKTAICDNGCGTTETLTDEGSALGHSFTDYVFNNDATCTTDGSSTAVCDRGCGATDTKGTPGSATGHNLNNPVIENNVDPDCVNPGSYDKVVYCGTCNFEYSRETVDVDALGHTPADAVVENNVDPDCVNPGSYDSVVYCSVCNAEISRQNVDVDALGHSGGTATCTEPASCEVCGAEYGSALGHNFNNYRPDGNATCLEDGTKTSKCSRCDAKDTMLDAGSALGHSFTNYTSDGNATCLEDGTKTAKCDNNCGLTDTQPDEGSMLAHEPVLEENPDAFVLYLYCAHCGGEKEFGKVQIPVAYRMPLLKASVVLACLLVIICSIRALTRPATTTPFFQRRKYR